MTGDLSFEHVGTLACGDRLLLCDVEYIAPRFAGMGRGALRFDVEVEIVPGTWQVLVARDSAADPDDSLRFVLLTHERELDDPAPLDEAEAIALLRVDSGRITALDPELRADPLIQTAVIEAPREQVPCMLRDPAAPEHAAPRGALLDVDLAGVFELYAGAGEPRSSLFLAVGTGD